MGARKPKRKLILSSSSKDDSSQHSSNPNSLPSSPQKNPEPIKLFPLVYSRKRKNSSSSISHKRTKIISPTSSPPHHEPVSPIRPFEYFDDEFRGNSGFNESFFDQESVDDQSKANSNSKAHPDISQFILVPQSLSELETVSNYKLELARERIRAHQRILRNLGLDDDVIVFRYLKLTKILMPIFTRPLMTEKPQSSSMASDHPSPIPSHTT